MAITRQFAKIVRSNTVAQQLLEWLKDTHVADEHFWATLAGNLKLFPEKTREFMRVYNDYK